MKLTPLDIRKQEFSRRVRGVDEEEVKAFLQMVASQWEEVQDEFRRLEDKVRDVEGKLEHYKRVEEALQEALRTARENAKEALETARQKASVIVQEAEASAVHIKRDADDERRKMKRQIARLSHRRDEIVSRLRAFLMSEMEMLARFEGDDAVGFIKLMPAQERQLQEAREQADLADEDFPETGQTTTLDPVDEVPEDSGVQAPLPEWAQFRAEEEGADAPDTASTPVDASAPAAVAPPASNPGPVAHAEEPSFDSAPVEDVVDSPADNEQSGTASFEPPTTLAGDEAHAADIELPAVDAYEALHEEEPHPGTFSDGDSVPHEPSSAPFEEAEDAHREIPPSDDLNKLRRWDDESEPAPAAPAPGISKWLGSSLFNAFKKEDTSAAHGGSRGGEPTETDGHDQGQRGGRALRRDSYEEQSLAERAQPAPAEEEEETFTVSSEEVERIRRILKGLD